MLNMPQFDARVSACAKARSIPQNQGWPIPAVPGSMAGLAVGRPQRLFQFVGFSRQSQAGWSYALLPDGRFVSVAHGNAEPIREIRVIINWFEELKARVPTK